MYIKILKELEIQFLVSELKFSDIHSLEKIVEIKTRKRFFNKRMILVISDNTKDKEDCIEDINKLLDNEKVPRPSIIWLKKSVKSEENLLLFNEKYLTFIHIVNVIEDKKEHDLDFAYEGAKYVKDVINIIVKSL